MNIFASVISGIVSPIAGVFTKRNDNKTKVKVKQIERLENAEDKLAEWESIQAESGNNSWKDEWITLIITMPIPVIFIAVMVSAITEDPTAADAAIKAVKAIKELIPNYEDLLYIVCLAAIGIKAIKK